MDFLELKKRFIKESGRYDLVVDTTSYVNNGVEHFLNEGHSNVIRRLDIPENLVNYSYALPTDTRYLTVLNYETITDVILTVLSSSAQSRLKKLSTRDYVAEYATSSKALQSGTPLYYKIGAPTINFVTNYPKTVSGLTSEDDSISVRSTAPYIREKAKSVWIFPKPSEDCEITIIGKSIPYLVVDTDTSNVLINHMELVVLAALYELEVFYRNMESATFFASQLEAKVKLLNDNATEEDTSDMTELRG
jgi:hypothetical protein